MARENNFLLGAGERLTSAVKVRGGGGGKALPYDFATASRRASDGLAKVVRSVGDLPVRACPGGEAVALLTMHPRYISKSDYPYELLSAVGLHAIGSKPKRVVPDAWGIKKPPASAVSEEIFVAGPRAAFRNWESALATWSESDVAARQLQTIEEISPINASAKLRGIPFDRARAMLEVVLHNGSSEKIVESFARYAESLGAKPLRERRHDVRGLTFLPVEANLEDVEELALFSFVRVARGMPTLRPFRPTVLRASRKGFQVSLPTAAPVDRARRVIIFDGGVSSDIDLSPWVRVIEPRGIGKAVPDFVEHGTNVTGAFLFGPLRDGEIPPTPVCAVDHVRVLDDKTGDDLEVLDVLERITAHLDTHPGEYDFVSLSIGPDLEIDDEDVTAWTAELDQRFAHKGVLAVVAAGNGGDRDADSGRNRIQPPADCVNVLTVGAADCTDDAWARAEYSSVGPGRNPGVVKPDGVAFGGSAREPFMLLASKGPPRATGDVGTSFATPLVVRQAAGVAVDLGSSLSPLAIRALLIHRAHAGEHAKVEVGWGRFEHNPIRLITCDDDEVLVAYQGELPVGTHLRAPVPIPDGLLAGRVTLAATLVIAPEVDPSYPGAYTRSGLEVSFRPHVDKFTQYPDGSSSVHPKTKTFFSTSNMYGAAEYELRDDACKWEPCLRNEQTFNASSLRHPHFDIEYQHREAGAPASNPQPIPYALVVSVKAPKVPTLYSSVVRAYAGQLVQLRPKHRLRVRR